MEIRLAKKLYTINLVVFVITISLMITIYLGFLIEILLGFIQVLSSFCLLFVWKRIGKENQRKIFIYWKMVIVYFILWFLFDWKFLNDWIIYLVGIGLIPLCIAWYFISILKSINKGKNDG
ncbi:hypothetical protein [Polaribacter porphyrae]|nr:hypothetical protein [Polaribacter porphyrae]